jgi:hypothetical protein
MYFILTPLSAKVGSKNSPTRGGPSVGIFRLRTKGHGRMASSGMLRRVALVRTDVSEELSASITDSCHPDDGDTTFLRKVGSYKNHKA